MQIEGELNKPDEKYAIYSLCPEDPRFLKRLVSTKICVSPKSITPTIVSRKVCANSTYKIYNYDKSILSSLDNFHDLS